MVDFNGGGGISGLDPNAWMNNQPNAVGGLSGAQINAGLNPFAGLNQGIFNQAVDNSKGPSSGYGTVGGYPSFGGPGNYGGQNDPFSAGYAPSKSGFSGKGMDPRMMFGGAGADSGIAGWGSQPISPPSYTPPASTSFPAADPMNSGGYGGGGGGGAWDTSNMWGQPYAPPSGGANSFEKFLSDQGASNTGGGAWSTSNQFGQPYAPPKAAGGSKGLDPRNMFGGGGGTSSIPRTPAPENYPTPGGSMWGGRDALAQQISQGWGQQGPQGMQPQAPIQAGGGLNRPFGFGGAPDPKAGYFETGPEGAGVGGWGSVFGQMAGGG